MDAEDRTPPRRKHGRLRLVLYITLGLALYALVVGCGAFVFDIPLRPSHPMPKDQELIDNLTRHRSEFQELASMLQRDRRLESISPDSVYPSLSTAGISRARLERYRDLMRRAGIDREIQRGDDPRDRLWFRVASEGNVLTSDVRGYVYSATPLSPVFDSLDGQQAMARTAYRHVDGNWYLYRWIDP